MVAPVIVANANPNQIPGHLTLWVKGSQGRQEQRRTKTTGKKPKSTKHRCHKSKDISRESSMVVDVQNAASAPDGQ